MQVYTITNSYVFPYITAKKSETDLWSISLGELGEGRSLCNFTDFRPENPILIGGGFYKITNIEGPENKCIIFVKCEASLRGTGRIDGDIQDYYCHRCIRTLKEFARFCSLCGRVISVSHTKNPIQVLARGIVANGKYGDLGYFKQILGTLEKDCVFSIKICWGRSNTEFRKYFIYNGNTLVEVFR